MTVVSDTSPLSYLLLIGAIDVLPQLFGEVYVPGAVVAELGDDRGPDAVKDWKDWIAAPPEWLLISEPDRAVEPGQIDPGEAAAITPAEDLGADVLLVDDRDGRRVASSRCPLVVGTLGVLDRAAGRGLIDLPHAVERLLTTNFHVRPELIHDLLARHASGRP